MDAIYIYTTSRVSQLVLARTTPVNCTVLMDAQEGLEIFSLGGIYIYM